MVKNIKNPVSLQNIHFGKILLALVLIFTMVLGNVKSTMASGNTKTMTVTIGEGGVDQNVLSKTVTIPNLKEIVNVSVDTGRINHSVNGDKVVLNASGGNPSRSVENPKKYSKNVIETITRNYDSFTNTEKYNKGGFIGELVKRGGSRERLIKGTGNTKYVERVERNIVETVIEGDWGEDGLPNYTSSTYSPSPEYNDSDGYRGTLSVGSLVGREYIWSKTYRDYYEVRYRYERGIYSGTVRHVDRTVYEQDYEGTVYKAGDDNYYRYTVTIEYIDNSNPTIQISTPGENSYFV